MALGGERREAVEDLPDLAVARRVTSRIAIALDRYAEQIERARAADGGTR